MEIERKYLVEVPPADHETWPSQPIQQAYLCTEPVVRIRREGDAFYLTYKSKGLLSREEYNLPLTAEAYAHLLAKADGIVLTKRRYRAPLGDTGLTVELDVFSGVYQGLILAEVEFPDEETALAFTPPEWFGRDVTFSGEYQNSRLSKGIPWPPQA
ncbi:MAG TPA: CYTH domain-containing protein [Candidatus Ventrimonas merdavium]|nr:CYTH domain-containing protein [Candidatus Ventrimonas merdavium]